MRKNKLVVYLLFLLLSLNFLGGYTALAQKKLAEFDFNVQYYRDINSEFDFKDLAKKKFTTAKSDILNFGIDSATYWVKLTPSKNQYFSNDQVLFIDQSRLSNAKMYILNVNGEAKAIQNNQSLSFGEKKLSLGKIFNLPDTLKKEQTIFFKLQSFEIFLAPISIVEKGMLFNTFSLRDILFGIYSGIMLIMFIYNLFLFIIIKDKSYLYYVFYILFTWLTQISIQGFAVKYFWNYQSIIDNYSVVLFSSIALIFAGLFTTSFLNTKIFSKTLNKLIVIYVSATVINLGVLFLFGTYTSFIIMQVLTLVGAILALSSANYVYFKKHFKPAGYYLIAWSILLLGAVLFILKDYGIIPYNNFTIYLLQISSGIEVMLLSFALADKINFFKKENEIAQAQALNASLENAKLIREQNTVLEKNVKERTLELETANATLTFTLSDLKNTQSQLVDAEKMAALGQLTAGIAHEINNPINFVTSNIKPLELDINDLKDIIYKYEALDLNQEIAPQIAEIESFKNQIDLNFVNTEITSLLAGISEGARRTAEIIRSLKNFSRVDETDTKPIDLNEGIESTLVLIRNTIPENLTVIEDYGNLPKVECQPGKINQVFMNLVSNAIQAIKSRKVQREQEFLTLKSWYTDQQVKISIKDTGIGMTEEIKQRIFEPFFTTKDVGEGTGLGLSIVFGIIEKHKGHLEVITKVNEGTEFIITLQVNTQ